MIPREIEAIRRELNVRIALGILSGFVIGMTFGLVMMYVAMRFL